MSKIIILDKSVFQGTPQPSLCDLAQRHTVILSYVLCVECLKSSRNRLELLKRIQELIQCGAQYGFSPLELSKYEKANQSPVQTLIDDESTQIILNSQFERDNDFVGSEANEYLQSVIPIVEGMLSLGDTYYNNAEKKGYLSGLREEELTDRAARMQLWTKAVDHMIKDIIKQTAPDVFHFLTPDYYIWQDRRLRWILGFEWAYQKAKSGCRPALDVACHDFHDMQYVSYLAKSDCLLSTDERLVQPLAKAAFPDKEVLCDISTV